MEPLRTPLRLHRGVTVVEMLVVLSIIGILSIIVVLSQRTFNRSILLTYTAYDTALTIRTAETYGLSSRIYDKADKQTGYGVSFRTGTAGSFNLFADIDTSSATGCHPFDPRTGSGAPDAMKGDCFYDGASELLQTFSYGNGVQLSALDVYVNGSPTPASPTRTGLDIVFARPNIQAYFADQNGYNATIDKARITLTSSQDATARSYICVYKSGQMRVSSNGVC